MTQVLGGTDLLRLATAWGSRLKDTFSRFQEGWLEAKVPPLQYQLELGTAGVCKGVGEICHLPSRPFVCSWPVRGPHHHLYGID